MDSLNIIEDLKTKGHKNTKIRQALVEVILSSDSPLSIIDILQDLSKKNLSPNKTTVYREVEFLKGLGILQEVDFGDGKKRYEISSSHHHHIICINCKTIKDIPMEKDLDSFKKRVTDKTGFKAVGHSLEFFGLCSNCQ